MKKWIPKVGERYWYVSIIFSNEIRVYSSLRLSKEDSKFLNINSFQTRKQAQAVANKIKKLLS